MVYAYRSKIYLAEVALHVKDLDRQTAFYTQIIGLDVEHINLVSLIDGCI